MDDCWFTILMAVKKYIMVEYSHSKPWTSRPLALVFIRKGPNVVSNLFLKNKESEVIKGTKGREQNHQQWQNTSLDN